MNKFPPIYTIKSLYFYINTWRQNHKMLLSGFTNPSLFPLKPGSIFIVKCVLNLNITKGESHSPFFNHPCKPNTMKIPSLNSNPYQSPRASFNVPCHHAASGLFSRG